MASMNRRLVRRKLRYIIALGVVSGFFWAPAQDLAEDVQERQDSGPADSPLKGAPHTARMVTADHWDRAYSREQAAWPVPGLRSFKYWPPVGRIDNAWGDRNLFCSCDAWPEDESTG